MSTEDDLCDVCLYRRDGFLDGHLYPVNKATHTGICLVMESRVKVCDEHIDWVTDEFPETLEKIDRPT